MIVTCIALVPTQAMPTAAAISTTSASHIFSIEPRARGRIGTAVTSDMNGPQKKQAAMLYRRLAYDANKDTRCT